ncbi:MAG: AbrB/MazE/SpoVT family DNA-binding domain-containing protein, partial [Halobaculum sp.]
AETEATIDDSYSVTVPAAVREGADIDAGDKIRWSVDEDGRLSVAVVEERAGAFSELDPIETDEPTNAVDDHDRTPEFES